MAVGKQRKTPTGEKLPGTNKESHWYSVLTPEGGVTSSDTSVERSLADIARRLRPHVGFLSSVRKNQGRIEVLASTHSRKNYCIELGPELHAAYAELGATITVDIYPYRQNF
jgi:hypothetical protein